MYDVDLQADKCRSCSREAGPASPEVLTDEDKRSSQMTAEEIRQSILNELVALAEGMLTDEEFWQKYVLLDDVAKICGAGKKSFRDWCSYQEYPYERRRSPISGKWSHFFLIDTAKKAIRHRVGI